MSEHKTGPRPKGTYDDTLIQNPEYDQGPVGPTTTAPIGGDVSEKSNPLVFTPSQVACLNSYQIGGAMHPFTCPNDGGHPSNSVLVATIHGWICPFCDYTQDWAHDFMLNWNGTVSPPSILDAFTSPLKQEVARLQAERNEAVENVRALTGLLRLANEVIIPAMRAELDRARKG